MPPNHKTWQGAQDEFEARFTDRYGKRAFVCWLADTALAKGIRGKSALALPQPSDAIVTLNGHTWYAEVKSSENPVSFPFGDIRPSQWAASVRQVAAGGEYLFYLKSLATGLWFAVPAQVFHEIRAGGVKSAKWADLHPYQFAL